MNLEKHHCKLRRRDRFYVLQLLHPIGNASNCLLFLRWGRTGENGASQTKVCERALPFHTYLNHLRLGALAGGSGY